MQRRKSFPHYEFLKELSNLKPAPLFLILGQEFYLKDKVHKALIEKFTTPGSEDFDLVTFYGDNCETENVIEQLEMMPFMSKHRIIILKNFDELKVSGKNLIAEYVSNPVNSSILILTAEKPDERSKSAKVINEQAISIICRPPYNAEDIARWLRNELREQNYEMNNDSINLFANSIETDYLIAANELEKLIIYTKNTGKITIEDVKESVGKSKTDSVFDLQNALGNRNLKQALQVLENMLANNESAVFIITMLTRFFSQLWKIKALQKKNISDSEITNRYLPEVYSKFRSGYLKYAKNYQIRSIRKAFSLLLQADIDSKSLNTKEEIIMETLIYNLCKSQE
jgi:DNA polymerase-3 subunit delta